METLEIRVYDNIGIFDTLVDGTTFIVDQIKKWFESGVEEPLNISVKRMANKAPPELRINVSDTIKAEGGLV